MLSDQELVDKIRELYPIARRIEGECLNLFNAQWPHGRGPTGVLGESEFEWLICYLRSAANMLERIGIHRKMIGG
jgi:hypothetical protein